jgi:hypothetical protein
MTADEKPNNPRRRSRVRGVNFTIFERKFTTILLNKLELNIAIKKCHMTTWLKP